MAKTAENGPHSSPAACASDKSLEFLFDYTKFHIGCYLTLTSAYIAAAAIKFGPPGGGSGSSTLLKLNHPLMWAAIGCFMLAGLAGGTIASSITQTRKTSAEEFLKERIGPWRWKPMRAEIWTWIEHTAFWAGLICAVASIAVAQHCP